MNGAGFLAVTIQTGQGTDREAFNEWYREEHGPLRLRLPFVENGYRYRAIDGEEPQWNAIYDISDLAWLEKRIYTRLREERSVREQKMMGTFQKLDRRIFSLIATHGTASPEPAPVLLTVSLVVNESDLNELNKWYEEEHIGMLSKIPGWLRSRRFLLQLGGSVSDGQVGYLSVHDFTEKNGLDGPEHKASRATPWRNQIQDKLIARQVRRWKHYFTFEPLHEPSSTVVTTDGAELEYQLEGNPSDPVVVFVNSVLTSYHIWDEVAEALRTSGVNGTTYQTLRYNSRGLHQQATRSNPTRFDLLADDLEYLLQRLNIERVHAVVGVSMGGVTSINFAIRHPEMLEKFVACDCNTAASPANNKAWAERVELARSNGMHALADATVKRWFTADNRGSQNAVKVHDMIKQADVEGFEQNTGALCNYDLRDRLGAITTPGLLIAGEGDGKLPEVMQKSGIPGTSFNSVPGAGHLPMLENLKSFMSALTSFL
ncbi:alpha/beta-hydrolase [Polychaeton citri CBS 116435]|uniref:Alpha/beta-hydrolase n=1 Tax=Polychaeton citri CBS 116435 TaxID=1314669 RepID=A0A9P4QCY0_9PEZI|nr:alpha/beta-hydrolase [Polychaeton citri CBS 116435]